MRNAQERCASRRCQQLVARTALAYGVLRRARVAAILLLLGTLNSLAKARTPITNVPTAFAAAWRTLFSAPR